MEPNPDIQTEEQPKPVCSNCGEKMTRKGHFCPHCGQKKFDGRIRSPFPYLVRMAPLPFFTLKS